MPKVNLNGQVFSTGIAGLESVSATIRRSDGAGGAAFSFSGELTFYGEAYDILKALIIDAPVPHLAQVPITIYSDECPGFPFVGYVEGANATWCEIAKGGIPCSIKAQVIDGSAVAEKLACVKNTIIWDRLPKFDGSGTSLGEDTARKARLITYCKEFRPPALAEVIFILYMIQRTILTPIAFVIAIIVTIINAMITAINTIPLVPNIPEIDFDGNDDTNAFQELKNLLNQMNNLVTGCGAKHKAPFLHSYVQNVCDICGLSLSSSLIAPGERYNNLMRLDAAAYSEGPLASKVDIDNCYIKQRPNLNGGQLLDELRQNLNWEWWIDGGTLHIEPASDTNGLVWLEQGDGTVIKEFCIETTDETVKAYGVYEYQQDAVDNGSNETRNDWGAVIDWNTPPNAVQRGAHQHTVIYSAALFRKDNNGDKKLPIDKDFYNNSIAFPNLASWKNVLILNKGVSSQPKLLMWDGTSAQDNARVERWKIGDRWDYNASMWLKPSHPSGLTLYETSFEKQDNPRNADIRIRNFTMEICLSCALIETAPEARLLVADVGGIPKTGKIEQITINYATMTATISGKI